MSLVSGLFGIDRQSLERRARRAALLSVAAFAAVLVAVGFGSFAAYLGLVTVWPAPAAAAIVAAVWLAAAAVLILEARRAADQTRLEAEAAVRRSVAAVIAPPMLQLVIRKAGLLGLVAVAGIGYLAANGR